MPLWNKKQVACLNAFQTHGRYLPLVCENRNTPGHKVRFGERGVLIATKNGWTCPDCGYTSNWASALMLSYNPKEHPNWWEPEAAATQMEKRLLPGGES